MGILDSVANVIFGKPPDAPGVDPSLQRAMQNIEDIAGTSEDILKNIYGFSDDYFKTTLNPLIQANIQRQQSYLTATEDFLSKTRLSDQDLTDIADIRRSFLTDAAQDRTEEMQRKALADYRGQAERERSLDLRFSRLPVAAVGGYPGVPRGPGPGGRGPSGTRGADSRGGTPLQPYLRA